MSFLFRTIIFAILFSQTAVIGIGCVVKDRVLASESDEKLRTVIVQFVNNTHHWDEKQYRIEFTSEHTSEGYLVVNVIYLDDEKSALPGGGQSVQLYIDEKNMTVVRELGMQ